MHLSKFDKAVVALKERDEWRIVLEHLTVGRENLLEEFKRPEMVENTTALANLAGKIEVTDSLILELGGPVYPRDPS